MKKQLSDLRSFIQRLLAYEKRKIRRAALSESEQKLPFSGKKPTSSLERKVMLLQEDLGQLSLLVNQMNAEMRRRLGELERATSPHRLAGYD